MIENKQDLEAKCEFLISKISSAMVFVNVLAKDLAQFQKELAASPHADSKEAFELAAATAAFLDQVKVMNRGAHP